MCAHTHTRARTHTHTHICLHVRTRALTRIYIYTHTLLPGHRDFASQAHWGHLHSRRRLSACSACTVGQGRGKPPRPETSCAYCEKAVAITAPAASPSTMPSASRARGCHPSFACLHGTRHMHHRSPSATIPPCNASAAPPSRICPICC